jgi:hypothetical protein
LRSRTRHSGSAGNVGIMPRSSIITTTPPPPPLSTQSGYTLFLVLEMVTILAILFTVMLRDIQMVRLQAIREVHRIQARILAESGVEKAEFLLNTNSDKNLFWEGRADTDSFPLFGAIDAENRRFGLYSILTSSGRRVRTTCVVKAFAGRAMPKECAPVLTLHGKVGGVALMPGSSIKGTVVLSHGRICRGRTSQEVKEKELKVEIRESPSLPFDSSQAIMVVEKMDRFFTVACSSDIAPENRRHTASIDSLSARDTLVVRGDVSLGKDGYSNKTIVASGTITISGSASLLLCYCSGQKIVLQGGSSEKSLFFSRSTIAITRGRHNSQCIGKDSIVIGDKALFGPLSLCMLRREGRADSTAAIFIAPKTTYNGTLICSSDSSARTYARMPSIVLGRECVINGVCMTDGDVDLNGITIKGHLWARSIVTSDEKMAYTNFLFNVRMEEPLVEGIFPLIGSKPVKVAIDPVTTEYSIKKRKVLTERTKATEKKF